MPADVRFSDVFSILQSNCGTCHGMPGGLLPGFAQADGSAAYQVTQEVSNYVDEFYYERIVVRAVIERTMPPGCFGGDLGSGDCVSEREAAMLEAWVEQGAPL